MIKIIKFLMLIIALKAHANDIKIPLTNLDTESHKIILSVERCAPHNVFMHLDAIHKIAFQNNMPIKVLDYPGNKLIIFTRPLFKKGFNVFILDSSGTLEEIDISDSLKENGYFRDAKIIGNDVYFVSYRPLSSFDSKDGDTNDLYRLRKNTDGILIQDIHFIKDINKDYDIRYGIDRKIHIIQIDTKTILICSGHKCQKIDLGLGTSSNVLLPADHSICEVKKMKENIIALLAKSDPKGSIYKIYDIIKQKTIRTIRNKVPFNLHIDQHNKLCFNVVSHKNREIFLKHLILNSKDSGLLELGMSNDQARIAWSCVYYLNAFIDISSRVFLKYFDFLSYEFKNLITQRLKIEMMLLDTLLKNGVQGMETTRYSTRQQSRVYAVQTGRVLRLVKRYKKHFGNLECIERFKKETEDLESHEEIFYIAEDDDIDDIKKGRISLQWPKGVDFPFDGFKIPFNQQNDWASGVTYDLDKSRTIEARDIMLTFLEQSGVQESILKNFEWTYWYGRVRRSWKKEDHLSYNTPEYCGDLTLEDISYRTIDVMALLTIARIFPELLTKDMLQKFIEATKHGKLFPFVQEDLKEFYNVDLKVNTNATNHYLFCDSAWCLANVVWALKDKK